MRQYITVGVYDWQNFAQDAEFYPEDLPLEWRLGFYANEFDSACINISEVAGKDDLLEEWVQDLPDQFKLSFYLEHSDQFSILYSLLKEENCNIHSLIVAQSDRNILLQFERLKTLSYDSGCRSDIKLVEKGAIWLPQNPLSADSEIAMMPAGVEMRQYRNWINQWLQMADAESKIEEYILWLPGAQTDYKNLTDIRLLVEMMDH